MGNCNKKHKNPGGDPGILNLNVNNPTKDNIHNGTDAEHGFDHLFKILLIGDQGIGKTSLIIRYSEDSFPQGTVPTIGNVDFKVRTLETNGKVVKLQLWDTAGQEQFRTISSTYYRGANAIILAYSLDDAESFSNIKRQWKEEVDRYSNQNCAKIIVGCKSDLTDKRVVTKEQVQSLCADLDIEAVELSSKTGTFAEIELPFKKLAALLVETESL